MDAQLIVQVFGIFVGIVVTIVLALIGFSIHRLTKDLDSKVNRDICLERKTAATGFYKRAANLETEVATIVANVNNMEKSLDTLTDRIQKCSKCIVDVKTKVLSLRNSVKFIHDTVARRKENRGE